MTDKMHKRKVHSQCIPTTPEEHSKGAEQCALSTLRQTINVNIQFTSNTKLSKSQFYSNKTYNASSLPAGDAKLGPEHRTINNLVHVAGRATGEQRDAASRQESKHSSGDAAASEHSQALGIHRCSNLFKLFVLISTNVTYFSF